MTTRMFCFQGEELLRDWYTGLEVPGAWDTYQGYVLVVGLGWFESGITNGERYWNAA